MDKAAGKAFKDADGIAVEAQSEVIEIESDKGTAEVTFFIKDFDAYDNLTLVVFEKAYLVTNDGEILIASHEDIDDEDQTVTIPPHPVAPPEEIPPKTGDDTNIFLWAGLAAVALAGGTAAAIGLKRKKDDQNDERPSV